MRCANTLRIGTLSLLLAAACGDDGGANKDDTAADTTTASGDSSDATPDDTADATPAETAETADTADGGDADVIVGPRVTLVIEGAGYPAFTEMARAGLARAAAEVTIADHEVVVDLEDPFDLMDDAAADSDLLITIGFLFVDLVVELAELHPDVHFVVIDGLGPELDNVSYVEFAAEQGSFLVGAAAALTTDSRKLGFIGGVAIPPIDAFEAGFRAGAAHVALDVTVDAVRLSRPPDFGGFFDPEGARAEALRMYEGGVDVIFHAAGGSGAGLFQAAAERSEAGDDVWAIGVDADQHAEVDEGERAHVLTSMLKRVDEAVYRIVVDFAAGDEPSGYVLGDLAAGMVGYAKSGGFVDAIAAQLDAIASDIVSGAIVVPTEIPPSCDHIGTGVTSDGWTVYGGKPVRRGHSVQGCMLLVRESGNETRGGGVCLVADLHDRHPCETAADCASLSKPADGFHYCAAPEGAEGKTCWTRPGGVEYCLRGSEHAPGVIQTPLVPAKALPEATEWMAYACLANSSNASGCGVGESVIDTGDTLTVPMRQVAFYGGDGNAGDYLGEVAGPGIILEGMTHSLSGAGVKPGFAERIATIDPEVEDLFFAMETYDAVIIAALAAEVSRASTSAGIAEYLAGVTTRGPTCTDFDSCVAVINSGSADIDYDGLSGPIEMTAGGELARAPYTYVSFGADNLLDFAHAREVIVGDGSLASTVALSAPLRETTPTGGALEIGALLPETGPLAFLGPGARAAAELAVADINAAGGVNGLPVELVHADEGSFDDDVILESVETLLDAGVDVVIGAMASGQSLRVIDTIVGAGVVQISPANTSDELVDYDDDGLYFRTSPADRMQGRALAELIHRDGHARVALMAIDDLYGLVLAEAIERELEALGHPGAAILTTYHPYEGPFDESLTDVVAFEPDAIVLLGFDETALLIADLAALGLMPAPRPGAERACLDLDDGEACDDGDPCTRDTTCSAGWCGGGDALACGPGEDGAWCGSCGGATQACTSDESSAQCGGANVCSPQPNPGCGATSCCQDAAGYQSVCCGLAETFARRLCTGAGTCAGGGYPCGVGVTATCPEGSAPCDDAPGSCCNVCGTVGPLGCAVCEDESMTFTTRCEVYHDGDGCQAIVE
ncbi:MAG: BMP family ABC transporter substrate-binding protein [Deltaproteobacteria bacterium]|nr:BMP family ABC transporter substrate-binding protein [Deltaproteobacteria bacterium]